MFSLDKNMYVDSGHQSCRLAEKGTLLAWCIDGIIFLRILRCCALSECRMPSDAEFMSFSANAGTATLSVQVAPNQRSNLNMRLTLLDPSAAVMTAASRSGLTINQVCCRNNFFTNAKLIIKQIKNQNNNDKNINKK